MSKKQLSMNRNEQGNIGFQFDPGFLSHLSSFTLNIECVYQALSSYSNFNQKKLQFRMYYPKILSLLKNYVAFYLGCMLWAQYIKGYSGADILNNLCYGLDYDEKETLEEVNFIKDYLEKLKKDSKYYLGQEFSADESYYRILDTYLEFLKLNEGFTKVKITDDIKLPQNLKPVCNEKDLIKQKIDESVANGLDCLLEFSDRVL